MKTLIVATVVSAALGLTAMAQTSPSGSQATGANPSSQQQASPSQSPSMSDPGMSNGTQANETNGEKKLKGCIKSEGGKYLLEEKRGKEIALAGSQDFASHVGHTVTVHGTWGSGSETSNGASGTSSNNSTSNSMSAGGGQFVVSKLDMVSESCKMEKGSNAQDNMNSKPSPNRK